MKLSSVRAYSVNNLKYARKQSNTATNAISKQNNADNLSLNKSATNTPITYNISFGMARPSLFEKPEYRYVPTPYDLGQYNVLFSQGIFDDIIESSYDTKLLKLMKELAGDETAPRSIKESIANPNSFTRRVRHVKWDVEKNPLSGEFIKAYMDICPDKEALEKMILGGEAIKDADSWVLKLILDNLDPEKDRDLIGKIAKRVLEEPAKYDRYDDCCLNLEKDKAALEKFKETNPSSDEINGVLGKEGDFWYPFPKLAKSTTPLVRWNAALEILGMEPVNFKAEEDKYYNAKEEEKRQEAIRIFEEIIANNDISSYNIDTHRKIDRFLNEEQQNQLLRMLSFNDLLEEKPCEDNEGFYIPLSNDIFISSKVRACEDKESIVNDLLEERRFETHKSRNMEVKYCSPLYRGIKDYGISELFSVLDKLEDYPQLQYKILTSEMADADGPKYIYKPLNEIYSFIGKRNEDDLKKLIRYIETLNQSDEITDEQQEALEKIYDKEITKYARDKAIENAKAAKNAANS